MFELWQHFKINRSVFIVFICYFFLKVNCSIQTHYFITDSTLNNKVCTNSDKIFHLFVKSKLKCFILCNDNLDCTTIFYEPVVKMCTLCRGKGAVKEKIGTKCYSKNINCGTPPSVEGGTITTVEGNSVGDRASYTCSSCSHSPANGVGVILCQLDGTWTTPKCSPAIDVGYLPSGQVIPADAKGCMSTKGSRCLGTSAFPHVLNGLRSDGGSGSCWCGNLCCMSPFFCCYDVKC